ncbi:hypothetical protein XELAEV_18011583mg [Xenopus laevis]|uniref:Uncharacterized protein n=1 Tax=Xenopus laevis TaxID=8355 RepID=A0A974HXL7_XENLA|nr:hypothetical protein XELAEV_18011583mg [Xenopus laevis]
MHKLQWVHLYTGIGPPSMRKKGPKVFFVFLLVGQEGLHKLQKYDILFVRVNNSDGQPLKKKTIDNHFLNLGCWWERSITLNNVVGRYS